MKIDPFKSEEKGGKPASEPHETENSDTGTVPPDEGGKQAHTPKHKPGSAGDEYGFAGNEGEEPEEPDWTPPPSDQTAPPDLDPGLFPIHSLSPAMRTIVEELAEVHRVPVEMSAMVAVGVLAGALGNKFTLAGAVNGKLSHGNLYVVIGAAKSSGKGSISCALAAPLLKASAEMEKRYRNEERPDLMAEKAVLTKRVTVLVNELASNRTGTGEQRKVMGEAERMEALEELKEAQARLDWIEPFLDAAPTLWLGDSTSEAMARQFKRNNFGLCCYSPEAGSVVRVMLGKYSKSDAGDFDLYLSGYSVEPWRSDRIGRGVCQITPCLNMTLLCQPSILRELLGNEEAFERGMTARLLSFVVETEPQEDDGVVRCLSEGAETAWAELINGILARRESMKEPRRIICTPEAREVFRQFHNESVRLRRKEYRHIEAELGRWRENAIRIAIGLCVADNIDASELTGEQAERAVKIMRWCARSALKLTNRARAEKQGERADELQDILVRRRGEETLRNLNNSHGFKPEEVRALAGQFPDRFVVEPIVNTGGRPSEIARLKHVSE